VVYSDFRKHVYSVSVIPSKIKLSCDSRKISSHQMLQLRVFK
jgi:hypothetical protein